MMPIILKEQTPVPPPPYQRAQARLSLALHIDALTLVNTLHLLTLCHLAVGPGGAPRTYSEKSLLLIALLRTLWRLSRRGICATGYAVGLLLLWPAACLGERMISHVSPAPPSNGNADTRLAHRYQRRSVCSAC
jgi:hypothetical protein